MHSQHSVCHVCCDFVSLDPVTSLCSVHAWTAQLGEPSLETLFSRLICGVLLDSFENHVDVPKSSFRLCDNPPSHQGGVFSIQRRCDCV